MDNEELDGVKFSEFPSQTPVNADEVVGLHSGDNARFSIANIIAAVRQGLASIFVPKTDVGAANGVAELDSTGKVPSSQLPPIASTAADVAYDNTQSGLTATDVQEAIDELAQGGGGGSAANVTYDNTTSGASATNVQDALNEAFGDLDGKQSTITASGILKGDGVGGVSAATPGTDYQAPLTIDATPTVSSTNPVQSGGVYDALGSKLNKEAVSIGSSNDLNNIVEPGWYKCTTAPANAPSGNFLNAWFEVVVNGSNILQFAYSNPGTSTGPTPKVRLRLNGVWGDWGSFDKNYPYANQSQLAYVESGTTASRAYAVGEYFCWNGLLYRVTSAISSGGTFTPGTNCEVITAGLANAVIQQTVDASTGTVNTNITARVLGNITKIGKTATVNIIIEIKPGATVTTSEFYTLPAGFRPKNDVNCGGILGESPFTIFMRVRSDGQIMQNHWASKTFSSYAYIVLNATFQTE